jgi:hypothetical protein
VLDWKLLTGMIIATCDCIRCGEFRFDFPVHTQYAAICIFAGQLTDNGILFFAFTYNY